MATLIEVVGSREQVVSKEDPNYPLKLQVFGDDCFDDAVVRLQVEAYVPAFIGQMVFQRYQLHDQGAGNWLVDVYYGRKYARAPGDMFIHFDYTTEKVRTFTSYSSTYFPAPVTLGTTSPLQTAIQFNNCINVKDSGGKRRVEGVEVEDPAFNFTITRLFGPGFPLSQSFIDSLKFLRGKVNETKLTFTVNLRTATAYGPITFVFNPGELQFHGATGGIDEDTHQEVVMRFSSYENINFGTGGIPNCAGIPGVSKDGFDYLWVAYDEAQDDVTVAGIGNSKRIVPRPRQVCVERVFLRASLFPLFA